MSLGRGGPVVLNAWMPAMSRRRGEPIGTALDNKVLVIAHLPCPAAAVKV